MVSNISLINEPTKVTIIAQKEIADRLLEKQEWKHCLTNHITLAGHGAVEYKIKGNIIVISREGSQDLHSPSRTQYGANMIAAKRLGAKAVIGFSAVGSMREYISLDSLVIPDDLADCTGRDDNLFGDGFIVHLNPNPPYSPDLRKILLDAATGDEFSGRMVNAGTYVAIPGDRFATHAESRQLTEKGHVIGMAAPEATLAIELGIHYAHVAYVVNANSHCTHEGTLQMLRTNSGLICVYLLRAAEAAAKTEFKPLEQLRGNIEVGDLSKLRNRTLYETARELCKTYGIQLPEETPSKATDEKHGHAPPQPE
ncbi:hypothetical protein HY489_06795 [Candidatus Woesearchaeota archaeon]|nr:hypothetical protein [Candidatus Woesearchaeota archaeon]